MLMKNGDVDGTSILMQVGMIPQGIKLNKIHLVVQHPVSSGQEFFERTPSI
jgi:hypothetical protein